MTKVNIENGTVKLLIASLHEEKPSQFCALPSRTTAIYPLGKKRERKKKKKRNNASKELGEFKADIKCIIC